MSGPTRLEVPAPSPFHFVHTARSHGWVMLAPNAWDAGREAVVRVHGLGSGGVVRLEMERLGAGEGLDAGIAVRVEGPDVPTAAERREIEGSVAHMFRLDEDLSGFHARCRERGGAWEEAASGGFGRLLRSPTAFEDVVKTILTTNVQWGGTTRMARELVEEFGEPLATAGTGTDPEEGAGRARAFPVPEAIAAVPPEEFADRLGLGYRAPYVHELARRVASGDLELEALWRSDVPTPELEKELRGIKGVGPYAAATLLSLAGRYDALPMDSAFREHTARRHFGGERPTDAEARAVYDDWGEWRYLAYWFELWSDHRARREAAG